MQGRCNSRPLKFKSMDKSKIKWITCETVNSETGYCHSNTHASYPNKRETYIGKWTGETKDGNSFLCNKNMGVHDGDEYVNWDDMEGEELNENDCCKTCLKIYKSHKLTNEQRTTTKS